MDLHLIGVSATILDPESCGRFSACQRYLCTAFGSEDQEAIAIEYKPPIREDDLSRSRSSAGRSRYRSTNFDFQDSRPNPRFPRAYKDLT